MSDKLKVGLCAIAGAACYFQNPLHRLQIQLQMEQDESNENGEIQTAIKEKVNDLAHSAQSEDHAEIFLFIAGIFAAFRNHEGKNRQGQAADDTQDQHAGEEHYTNVVDGHKNGCQNFQGISGQEFWESVILIRFLIGHGAPHFSMEIGLL